LTVLTLVAFVGASKQTENLHRDRKRDDDLNEAHFCKVEGDSQTASEILFLLSMMAVSDRASKIRF